MNKQGGHLTWAEFKLVLSREEHQQRREIPEPDVATLLTAGDDHQSIYLLWKRYIFTVFY
jgi:hypothetical protein